VLRGELVLPLLDGFKIAELVRVFLRLDKIRAVYDRQFLDVVSKASGIRVLADRRALPDLLDDVFLDTQLSTMENLHLEAALGTLLDALGPVYESLCIRFGWAMDMVEA
jgi:hypothetical protein